MLKIPLLTFFILLTMAAALHKNSKSLAGTEDIDSCRNFRFSLPDFNKEKVLGIWYPINKSESAPIFSSCEYLEFSKPQSGDSDLVAQLKKRKGNAFSTTLTMNLKKTSTANSFTFSYWGIKNVMTVISTDYDNYAVAYVCTDMFLSRMYNAVILSRKETMDKEMMDKLIADVKARLFENKLTMLDHSKCAA